MINEDNIERLKSFPLEQGEIIAAEWHKSRKGLTPFDKEDSKPFYQVTMKLHPAKGSNITVAMFLPEQEDWNGRFMGTGNGGFAGEIALGALRNGLIRGYATANTDMGTPKDPDDAIGNGEVMIDFGYRATHLMTTVGKALTAWFYGRKPERAYFFGGSTGGQQAFSEAQRYPEDYDGIIALSPAFDRVRLHAFFIWNWQRLHEREGAVFTQKQAKKWKEAVVRVYREQCLSNRDDDFLAFPGGVKGNPLDHPELQKDIAKLLTPPQQKALRRIYDGPKDPVTGEPFIAGFLPGTEAESLSLADFGDREKIDHDFFYIFRWLWGKDVDFMKFDFHQDLNTGIEELSPILDATDPDLSRFRELGHKLLVIGGSVDAIVPYQGFLDYYHQVIEKNGGLKAAREFLRFFLMPGFSHTFGGPGVQEVGVAGLDATPRDPEHDAICAMERWVEQGEAPERLLGTHLKISLKGVKFDYARPAYAYPYVARFQGGDPKDPKNYCPEENAEIYEYQVNCRKIENRNDIKNSKRRGSNV